MAYAVEVENLSKIYKKEGDTFFALKNINLCINKGEVFSILGPNGAGKTTLLKIISTLVLPSSGVVKINGYDICRNESKVRRIIGVSTGFERSFYYRLSGYRNLLFFGSLYGIPRNILKNRIKLLLKEFDLDQAGYVPYMKYSMGMKKKLSIIRALLHDPDIFIFDEPMSSLDVKTVIKLREKIHLLKKSGKTIIIATHNIEEAEKVSDRIAVMNKGVIKKIGTPHELKKLLNVKIVDIFLSESFSNEKKRIAKIFHDWIYDISDNKISLALSNEGELSKILKLLELLGVSYFDITIHDSDLEKIFIFLTEDKN